MKSFTLFWLTGEKETINGYDIADALNRVGYSSNDLRALDFYISYAYGDNDEYIWDGETWIKREII